MRKDRKNEEEPKKYRTRKNGKNDRKKARQNERTKDINRQE